MRQNRSLDRGRRKRPERTKVLVVTEGTQTEKQYFGLLVQHLKATGVKHWPITPHGVGKDPARVLQAALDRRSSDEDSFDSVWIVVDVDDHTTLSECLELAQQEGVRVVVSNPCFEIWLVWHLGDHRREDDRFAVQDVLKSHGYPGKSLPAKFPVDKFRDALARAASADRHCTCGTVGRNPSSAMPKLIEYLLSA